MNEAEKALVKVQYQEWQRLQWENARLRELLKESKRHRRVYKQGAWIVEERHTWTDEDIDRRLRNGTGKD